MPKVDTDSYDSSGPVADHQSALSGVSQLRNERCIYPRKALLSPEGSLLLVSARRKRLFWWQSWQANHRQTLGKNWQSYTPSNESTRQTDQDVWTSSSALLFQGKEAELTHSWGPAMHCFALAKVGPEVGRKYLKLKISVNICEWYISTGIACLLT